MQPINCFSNRFLRAKFPEPWLHFSPSFFLGPSGVNNAPQQHKLNLEPTGTTNSRHKAGLINASSKHPSVKYDKTSPSSKGKPF